jgi:HEAT repeat protein/MFS family permease
VALLVGLMFAASMGGTIGGSAINALFFARYGIQSLPTMYMAMGVITSLTLLSMSALLGVFTRERLYVWLPVLLGGVLVAGWAFMMIGYTWFYPVLWLGGGVIGTIQDLFTWGLAGITIDTRQAKRLFPLFGAGNILGSVIGGLITRPLAHLLHSENLLLLWAAGLAVAFLLGRVMLSRMATRRRPPQAGKKRSNPFDQIRQGYRFVQRSQLMRWIVVSAVLFSVLSTAINLPFNRAATVQFPDEDTLAGFLGAFQGATTGLALLVSLFVTNRLFARLGIMTARMGLPIIYLVGFAILAAREAFWGVVIFNFFVTVWSMGISRAAYQSVFNVVPAQQREQTRFFMGALPDQIGIIVAGLVSAIGQQVMIPQVLYLTGLVCAAAGLYVLWKQKRAYTGALVSALHAGRPQVFFSEEEPFGGYQRDGAALSLVLEGLSNPAVAVRRISAEILCHVSTPSAIPALIGALSDPDTGVQTSALRALVFAKASPALVEIAACLKDPDPEVRVTAIEALQQLAGHGRGMSDLLRPLLSDEQPMVRARAAAALLQNHSQLEALDVLVGMARSASAECRTYALMGFGQWGDGRAVEFITAGLHDPEPNVRSAAAQAFTPMLVSQVMNGGHEVLADRISEPLIQALSDRDPTVRATVVASIGQIGSPLLWQTVEALTTPQLEDGALAALERLPIHQAADAIRRYGLGRAASARYYHSLQQSLPRDGGDALELLSLSLWDKAQCLAINALRAAGLLTDPQSMAVTIENLNSPEGQQRAYAVESLESMGEQVIVRPLLNLWEPTADSPMALDETIIALLGDPDDWLRACAAQAAVRLQDQQVQARLAEMAYSDEDMLVRETAALALNGGLHVESIPTLSLMERILFLHRVRLFGDLSPADLKHIAALTEERYYSEGDLIVHQDEPGDEMFIIVSGEVQVLREVEDKKIEMNRCKEGEVLGEMAILSQEPRSATLVALQPTRLMCLEQKQFVSILRERPETSLAVMRVLIARLKESQARIKE